MTTSTKPRLLVVAVAAICALLPAWPAHAQGLAMARVNGVAIAQEQVDRQFDDILRERQINIARLQDPDKAKAFKLEAIDRLVSVELMWQEARRLGLLADAGDVDRALAVSRQAFGTDEAHAASLRRRGFDDEAAYRAHVHRMLSADRYARSVVEREVRIGDDDIAEFYAANPRQFKQPERVRIRQIVVAVAKGDGRAAKAQARQRASALLARVRAGEDFEALAREHSDDATRSWGGQLDPFGRGEQAKPIEDAAFALAPGAVSGLIETAAGFHIVKLEQRLAGSSVTLDAARPAIRDYLQRTRGQAAIVADVTALRSRARIHIGP